MPAINQILLAGLKSMSSGSLAPTTPLPSSEGSTQVSTSPNNNANMPPIGHGRRSLTGNVVGNDGGTSLTGNVVGNDGRRILTGNVTGQVSTFD